jgi:ferritin
MIVTFKRNYDVQIYEEDKHMSGMFTFMKGKGYEAEYTSINNIPYIEIWNIDKSADIIFRLDYAKEYLYD